MSECPLWVRFFDKGNVPYKFHRQSGGTWRDCLQRWAGAAGIPVDLPAIWGEDGAAGVVAEEEGYDLQLYGQEWHQDWAEDWPEGRKG